MLTFVLIMHTCCDGSNDLMFALRCDRRQMYPPAWTWRNASVQIDVASLLEVKVEAQVCPSHYWLLIQHTSFPDQASPLSHYSPAAEIMTCGCSAAGEKLVFLSGFFVLLCSKAVVPYDILPPSPPVCPLNSVVTAFQWVFFFFCVVQFLNTKLQQKSTYESQ